MRTITEIKSLKIAERKREVEHIKTLIFYSDRAAKETKMEAMIQQTNRLKEFLKLLGFKK